MGFELVGMSEVMSNFDLPAGCHQFDRWPCTSSHQ